MNTNFYKKSYHILITLSLVLYHSVVYCGQSHNVVGELRNNDGSIPFTSDIVLEAWMTSRPNEILTESSPGCGFGNPSGWWYINIGNFPTDWDNLPPYSDTLYITFTNKATREKAVIRWVIDGEDNIGTLQLQKLQPPTSTEVTNIFPPVFTPSGSPPHNRIRIEFTTKVKTSNIHVMIFDTRGRKLKTSQLNQSAELVTLDNQAYAFYWNGRNEDGKLMRSGIYIYQINIENKSSVTGSFGLIR